MRCKNYFPFVFVCFVFLSTTSFFDGDISNQAATFSRYFPDNILASVVAGRLNKQVTDKVTLKELASIHGCFSVCCEPPVADLTGIGYLIGIDSFDCYKNYVKVIPPEIGKLKNLVYLDLCKAYYVNKIPAEIGELTKLKGIRLSLTEISKIPKEIGKLSELETLDIGSNYLTDIPEEIGNLTKLKRLDIHDNKIAKLPNTICDLTSLTVLDASHCGLKQLPEDIGNLTNLKSLNLFNNDIRYLPKSIANLSNLRYLNIFDNFKLSESYKSYLPKSLKKKK